MLLQEWAWAVALLVTLGVMGGFVVIPFAGVLRFPALAAPAAGLLCLGSTTAAAYTILGLSLGNSVLLAATGCGALTLLAALVCRPAVRGRDVLFTSAVFLLLSITSIRSADATPLRLHAPAILYIDGTDHLGYTHVADWLVSHPVTTAPQYSPERPYEAYPSLLFRNDPRFGSFFFLAAVAWARGLPATFVYDFACAVALAAMLAGAAAVFARSRLALVFLGFALFAGQWYDLGQSGFLGKLIAYPAAIVLVGLYLQMPDAPSAGMLYAVGVVATGAAIMHSGLATALIFASAAAIHLALQLIVGRKDGRQWTLPRALAAGAIASVVVLATGVLARPVRTAFPEILQFDWKFVLVRCLDLKSQWTAQSSNNVNSAVVAGVVWAALLILAMRAKQVIALTMLASPVLIFAIVAVAWGRSGSLQLVGVIYPLTACGAVCLVKEDLPPTSHSRRFVLVPAGIAALCVGLVALRLPRLSESLHRYAGKHTSGRAQFSLGESEGLSRAIGAGTVTVDLVHPQEVIFILVELGRRGLPVQWSPRAWDVAVGYTGWPPPRYSSPGDFELVAVEATNSPNLPVALQTPHFKLLRIKP